MNVLSHVLKECERLHFNPAELINVEKRVALLIKEVAQSKYSLMEEAICYGFEELYPLWQYYAPKQRGKNPKGDNIPFGDAAEKIVGISLLAGLLEMLGTKGFLGPIGLPHGGDYRWVLAPEGEICVLHLDIKATGPRDNPKELVVSTNQVTGFPDLEETQRRSMFVSLPLKVGKSKKKEPDDVYPALPPLVPFRGKIIPQITTFVKVIYEQKEHSQQLSQLKIALVPNGILLLGPQPHYSEHLKVIPFRRGKDDKKRKDVAEGRARFRIPLDWLAKLDEWRLSQLPIASAQHSLFSI